ncbi:MAG: hypothetical protein GY757_55220, partial [bacterium]|nr:hypothetical protein [bacterium]
ALRVLFIGNSYTEYNDLHEMVSALDKMAVPPLNLQCKSRVGPGFTLEDHWKGGKTLKKIHEGKWDYVVLQEQSQRPYKEREKMFRFAQLFHQEIKKNGAETLLFMTWARYASGKIAEISEAYCEVARRLDATAVPVGLAWDILLTRHPGIRLHNKDGSHPNEMGTYLAACVFYSVITGQSPPPYISGSISGVNEIEAEILRKIALETTSK